MAKMYGAMPGYKKGYKTVGSKGAGEIKSQTGDTQAGERKKGTGKRVCPPGTKMYGSV